MRTKPRWPVLGAGFVLYTAALALPSFNSIVRNSDLRYSGLDAFRTGFNALTSFDVTDVWLLVLSAAWLANAAMWISFIAIGLGRWRIAGISAAVGLLLSLQVLPWFGSIVVGCPGYWAWCGTAALLLGSSCLLGIFGEGSGTPLFKIRKIDERFGVSHK